MPKHTAKPPLAPELPETLEAAWLEAESFGDQSAFSRQMISDADLSGTSAEDVSFDQVLLRRCLMNTTTWAMPELRDARLDGCDLANARWEKPHIQRAELLACRMLGLSLLDGQCDNLVVRRCNAEAARFWNLSFRGVLFEQCILRTASFTGSDLSGAVFRGCDLSGADLRKTKLLGTDLRGCNLSGAQLAVADLRGAILEPQQLVLVAELLGVDVRALDA